MQRRTVNPCRTFAKRPCKRLFITLYRRSQRARDGFSRRPFLVSLDNGTKCGVESNNALINTLNSVLAYRCVCVLVCLCIGCECPLQILGPNEGKFDASFYGYWKLLRPGLRYGVLCFYDISKLKHNHISA